MHGKREKMKGLSERLICLRNKKGLTQEEAAAQIGVKYGTYQTWEYGKHPNRNNLEKIALFYGCSLGWLMSGEGEPFPDHPEARGPEVPPYDASHMESPVVAEAHSQYTADRIPIADDLTKTARVLESETAYATALHMNILSFHQALNMEESCDKVLKQQDALKKRMDELSGEVLILQGQLLGEEDTSSGAA